MVLQLACEIGTVPRNQFSTKGFLALEIMIERPLRDTDTPQNFVNTCRTETFLRQNLDTCTQEHFASIELFIQSLGWPTTATDIRAVFFHPVNIRPIV